MDDWLKWGLGGAAGLGLLALSGGTAAAGLGSLLGSGGTAAAGTAGAAAGTGAAAGAGATAAGAVGAGAEAATVGGMLAPEATAGAGMFGAGSGAATAPASMMFTTPPVTGAAGFGELSGTLAGTDLAYGSTGAIADASAAAAAAPPPSMLAQLGGYAKTGATMAGKGAAAFGAVNQAMGGGQPTRGAPAARPVFQGPAPQIAPQAPAAQNNNAVLAAIARRRQRGF